MRGHPEEGQKDGPVNGALHVSHRQRRGQDSEVEAARGVMQVRVQASLQGLVEHHLVGTTQRSGGNRVFTFSSFGIVTE